MSVEIKYGVVFQEVVYSPKIRRTCCLCGSKRYITHLRQYEMVTVGASVKWCCIASCLKKQATSSRAVATTVRAPIHDR